MKANIVCWDNIGIVENKMEATITGYIGWLSK